MQFAYLGIVLPLTVIVTMELAVLRVPREHLHQDYLAAEERAILRESL